MSYSDAQVGAGDDVQQVMLKALSGGGAACRRTPHVVPAVFRFVGSEIRTGYREQVADIILIELTWSLSAPAALLPLSER